MFLYNSDIDSMFVTLKRGTPIVAKLQITYATR